MRPSPPARRTPSRRALPLAAALAAALCATPCLASGEAPRDQAASFREHAAVEKQARSRYRRLEVASAAVIVAAGGAAILWFLGRR